MTPKQQRFVSEYLLDLNATQAAIRAGYSEKTARQVGSENLSKPDIAAAIQAEQAKLAATNGVTVQRVVSELARIGFSDLRGVFDEAGNLRPIQNLPEDTARMIASVEVAREKVTRLGDSESGTRVEECIVKVKAWDKVRALEQLAKHLGMFTERVQHEGEVVIKWAS